MAGTSGASRKKRIAAAIVVVLVILLALAWRFRGYLTALLPAIGLGDLPVSRIAMPEGFSISVFAEGVTGARSLAIGPDGTVYVGSRDAGRVHALPDADRDGRADRVLVLAEGLNSPNGVALRDGDLYVAEISRVLRFRDVAERLDAPGEPEVVADDFPTATHHGWKFIAFGPDGLLYVPVGAPCNVCESSDPRFASIMRLRPGEEAREIFAHGVRNTVGFDWHPETGELWFTDNGRDWMGDDAPRDELNHAPRAGLHFGFPYRHADGLDDPDLGPGPEPERYRDPARLLGPHVAALGMRFYDGDAFPPRYRGGVFIAEHGSWNRSEPIGYRITFVPFREGAPSGYEVFAEGWLVGTFAWGRPVDVAVTSDGALLVSDDRADAIYRISHAR